MKIILQIMELCVVPLLGILIKYLVSFLTAKKEELKLKADNDIASKYIDMVYKTVCDCVAATNQTFVEGLKNSGQFDEAAQKEAFNRTLESVLAILTDDAKEYLTEATGDIKTYLTQLIESQVNAQKK